MTGAVWDREFFRRRAEDDNTALLFEDQPWSWRELLGEAATRSAAMVKVRPEGRPWHIGVLLENTPEYVFLIAGAALCGATVVGINPTRRGAGLAAYNAMPIFHGNALMSALGPCIANGAAFALRRRFSASGFRPDIRRFGATLVERILVRFPGVTAAAVYPVPTRSPVTRSWRRRRRAFSGSPLACRKQRPIRSASLRCAACCGTERSRSTSAWVLGIR